MSEYACRKPGCDATADSESGRSIHEGRAHPDFDFSEVRFNDSWKAVESGCWEWTGWYFPTGYGGLSVGGNEQRTAHRVSYELHYGEIPDGKNILHKCDNEACVNPDHLYAGTQQDNIDDAIERGGMDRKGENHHNAKLTWDEVNEMRERYDGGERIADLVPDYDVCRSTIINAIKRETWVER